MVVWETMSIRQVATIVSLALLACLAALAFLGWSYVERGQRLDAMHGDLATVRAKLHTAQRELTVRQDRLDALGEQLEEASEAQAAAEGNAALLQRDNDDLAAENSELALLAADVLGRVRPALVDYTAPPGLFCRDLHARGASYAEAVDYWYVQGAPDRMDADLDGIPCETVYPEADVDAFWTPVCDYDRVAIAQLITEAFRERLNRPPSEAELAGMLTTFSSAGCF